MSSTEDFLGWTDENAGTICFDQESDEESDALFRLVNGIDDFPKLNSTYEFDRLQYPAHPSMAVYLSLSEYFLGDF